MVNAEINNQAARDEIKFAHQVGSEPLTVGHDEEELFKGLQQLNELRAEAQRTGINHLSLMNQGWVSSVLARHPID